MKIIRSLLLLTTLGLIAGSMLASPDDARTEPPCHNLCWGKHLLRHCSTGRPAWNMDCLNAQAAAAVGQALNTQIQNGEAMERTIWNSHFQYDDKGRATASLHPSGLALLHRLARRSSSQAEFVVLVETAHDMEFTPEEIDEFARSVQRLDAERVLAVQQYVTRALRRPDVRILLHDPPVLGMSTQEATAIYQSMIGSAKGALEAASKATLGMETEARPEQLQYQPSMAETPVYRQSPDSGIGIQDTGGAKFVAPSLDSEASPSEKDEESATMPESDTTAPETDTTMPKGDTTMPDNGTTMPRSGDEPPRGEEPTGSSH